VTWLGEVIAVAAVVGVAMMLLSGLVRAVVGGGRRGGFGAAALDGALVASLAAVGVATLSPLRQLGTYAGRPEVQLTPLERLDGAPVEFAVINLLLLVPTVLLLAQRWRRAGVVRLTLVGAVLSVGIEITQLLHPARGTNVDDVILNTAGAAGAAIVGVTIRWVRKRRRRPPRSGGHPPREDIEAELDPPLEPAS
jgi:hypothetical protein